MSLPSDISVDLASMQEKVNMAQRIIDTTDTAALESSLDTVEVSIAKVGLELYVHGDYCL